MHGKREGGTRLSPYSRPASPLTRREGRGAHSRPDYPKRDDVNWMKHTLYFQEGDRLDYKPVRTKPLTVESFPPKERVY